MGLCATCHPFHMDLSTSGLDIRVCVCTYTPKYMSSFISMAQVVASLMRKLWENDARSAPRGTAKFGVEAWHSGCQVSGSQSP